MDSQIKALKEAHKTEMEEISSKFEFKYSSNIKSLYDEIAFLKNENSSLNEKLKSLENLSAQKIQNNEVKYKLEVK